MHLRFIISVVKSLHSIPQTVTLTPFREPMLATSHFNILDFKYENFVNNLKVLISSIFAF